MSLTRFVTQVIFSILIIIVHDNRALSEASEQARKLEIPLLVIFAISPQDYAAHDRGPRRIDFMLRNLASLKVWKQSRN